MAKRRAGICNHKEQGDQMSSRRHLKLTSTTGEFGDRESLPQIVPPPPAGGGDGAEVVDSSH
eukprot:COSAG05_NODE_7961_length_751_cov_3.217791_1_plen_61_part_10